MSVSGKRWYGLDDIMKGVTVLYYPSLPKSSSHTLRLEMFGSSTGRTSGCVWGYKHRLAKYDWKTRVKTSLRIQTPPEKSRRIDGRMLSHLPRS